MSTSWDLGGSTDTQTARSYPHISSIAYSKSTRSIESQSSNLLQSPLGSIVLTHPQKSKILSKTKLPTDSNTSMNPLIQSTGNEPKSNYFDRNRLRDRSNNDDDSPGRKAEILEISMRRFLKEDNLQKIITEAGSEEGCFLITNIDNAFPKKDVMTAFEFTSPINASSLPGHDQSEILNSSNSIGILSGCISSVDAGKEGRLGADEKRVISIHKPRLEETIKIIESFSLKDSETSVINPEFKDALKSITGFFEASLLQIVPRLLASTATAIGDSEPMTDSDLHLSYRLVDYYERPWKNSTPRCGEHRDFSLISLVFQDTATDGLEVKIGKHWYAIPPKPNSCVVMFGMMAAWKSNDRIKACKHRVANPSVQERGKMMPRRLAAVLFVGISPHVTVSPTLLSSDEEAKYKTKTVSELIPNTSILKQQGTAGKASLRESALKKGSGQISNRPEISESSKELPKQKTSILVNHPVKARQASSTVIHSPRDASVSRQAESRRSAASVPQQVSISTSSLQSEIPSTLSDAKKSKSVYGMYKQLMNDYVSGSSK